MDDIGDNLDENSAQNFTTGRDDDDIMYHKPAQIDIM